MTATDTEASRIVVAADRLVTGPDPTVIRDAAVEIQGGHITAVGSRGDAASIDIDLGARTLVPGMIDAHVHLAKWPEGGGPLPHHQTPQQQLIQTISNAQRLLRVGVTAVRDLGSPGDIVSQAREAVDRDTLQGCRIQTSNEVLTITGGHGNSFGTECDDELALRVAVRQHVKQGSDWIKLMASGGFTNPYRSERETPYSPLFTPEELGTAVREAHRFGLPVTAHCHGRDAIAAAFEAGVDTLEHATFADKPVARVDLDLARAIGEAGVPVVPTTNNYWLGKGLPWAPLDVALANLKLLHDCGITLVAGTDMGLHSTVPERYVDGLVTMARAGIPPHDIFAAATSHAAAALQRGDDLGRVEPGYRADLVALDGDPLLDVEAYGRVDWVMKGGTLVHSAGPAAPEGARPEWSGVHLFGNDNR